MRTIVVAFLALSLSGCASVLCDVTPAKGEAHVRLPESKGRTATFRYLGAGGWLIRRGDDVVLTAPFFSNPRLLWVPFAKPNHAAIDAELAHIDADLKDVRAVIAGHAHYDHIMDLPRVLPRLKPKVPLVGSVSVCNSLASELHEHPCEYKWSDAHIRVRPFKSEHAPHWHRLKLMRGRYDGKQLDHPPATAWRFREGEPTAYLIEFLDGEDVALRVYYTDAAANPGKGIPDLKDDEKIDVAILTVASFQYVREQPETIVRELHNPKHLLLGHWENFFWPARNEGCRVPFTNVNKYMRDLDEISARYTLPDRRTTITVEY